MTRKYRQCSGAVLKWRWPSRAPVPNKPTVSVDVKQHFNINTVSPPPPLSPHPSHTHTHTKKKRKKAGWGWGWWQEASEIQCNSARTAQNTCDISTPRRSKRMSLPDENDSFRLNEYARLTGSGGGSLFSGAKCHGNERNHIQNEERKNEKAGLTGLRQQKNSTRSIGSHSTDWGKHNF